MMTRINAFIRVNSNKNMTEHLFQVDINLKKMLFLGNCNFILKWYNVSTKLCYKNNKKTNGGYA